MAVSLSIYDNSYIDLARKFEVDPSSCDNPIHYNEFLMYNADLDYNKGLGVTYILVDDDKDAIIAYMTLKASALTYSDGNDKILGKPAVEIAELAVSKNYKGQGYGRELVEYAIAKIHELKEIIGVQYLVLCADPMAAGFYEHLKIQKLTSNDIPREDWNKNCIPMGKKIIIY